MALLKKKKDAKPQPPADSAKPGKLGKLLGLAAPVLVFAAAFGTSWMLGEDTPTYVPAPSEVKPEPEPHTASWRAPRPSSTLALDPMTITAGAQGQVLKISLSVEVWEKEAYLDTPRLRDAFTAYLRAIDAAQLSDPAFHMRLKRALLHRARVVSGEDVIADVLITDFLLTS